MGDLDVVHTLDARGHTYLEVIRDYFSLDAADTHHHIRSLRNDVEKALKARGVIYNELRSALTPDQHRREIAFIFDTYELRDEAWFGLAVFKRFMPLLDKRSSHSVLVGDYFGENHQQDKLYDIFFEAIVPAREITWRNSGLFYVIYINNLSDEMVENFHAGLLDFPAYSGFADCTYDSRFKLQMSLKLCSFFLKHKDIILQSNPDDGCSADYGAEDYNTSGYPFAEFGYRCKSLNDILFGVFLSFKIERAIYEGFEADTEFGLNAIMSEPASLKGFRVSIDEAKMAYLKKQKASVLGRAGVANTSASSLAALIDKKIANNYIYEMRINHGAKLFNVMVEIASEDGAKTRLRCGLRFDAPERQLKLVTMF